MVDRHHVSSLVKIILSPHFPCNVNHFKQKEVPMQRYLAMGIMSQQDISSWKVWFIHSFKGMKQNAMSIKW